MRSLLFYAALLFSLPSCSNFGSSPTPTTVADYSTAQMITQRCGEISGGEVIAVTSYIRSRLLTSLSRVGATRYPITLSLLACPEPFAYSIGNGVIIFSHGMVRSLRYESELAFVIAHEIAHDYLDHHRSKAMSQSAIAEREISADRFAVGLVAYAGYDPRSAVSALLALSKAETMGLPKDGHPSSAERIAALNQAISDSDWSPPGILNRRDFQQLQQTLKQMR